MTSHRVLLRDGLALRAQVAGEGKPVLLLHGFSGSAESWGSRIPTALAERGRVIAVDLLGHGGSDAPPDPARCSLPSLLEDLSELLDALEAPRAHWIGYSMGGRLALGAALLVPERVERLVLEGASPGLATEAERSARREQDEALARRLEARGIEAFVDEWAALPIFASQRRLPQVTLDAQRRRRLQNDPGPLAATLRGLGTGSQPSFWDRLSDVRAPVLLLTGAEDLKFTQIAEKMAKQLPVSRSVTVPGAGHCAHLEAPETWLEAVRAWLD